MAHENACQAEDEAALKMKELFFDLLATERRKRAGELRIEAGEAQLAEARNAVNSGTALELKTLEGQANLAEARHQLLTLEDAIADMQVEFNDLAGLPLEG
jgi:outer membrane protein TolC